jgi:large subunit ribosomal protein L6
VFVIDKQAKMSRIGKQPINIPGGVTAEIQDRSIKIKGPKGELSFDFGYEVEVRAEGREIRVEKKGKTQQAAAMWGTTRSIIQNLIKGVTEGFEKKLELHGVGYKMALQGKKLVLNLGFSHPIEREIPAGLEAAIEKNTLIIKGCDKQQVGQFAAEIRALKKVEPYKGKGFRYEGEQFIKKEGKRAVGGEA